MSRCFPFPPPGFSGNCSSNQALILSIKLQRENEKANTDREREKSKSSDRDRKKEKKREKEEKKRQKEEKKRQKEERGNYALDSAKQKLKLTEKLYQDDKCTVAPKDKCSLRGGESEVKSTLTEEHGRPVDLSCSSDSTGNSGKRKRHSSSPSGIQSQGSVIRIRLSSSHRTDDPSTSGCKEQEYLEPLHKKSRSTSNSTVQPCSNLLRADSSAKLKDLPIKAPQDSSHYASTSNATFQLPSIKNRVRVEEKPCFQSAPPKAKLEEKPCLQSAPPKEKLSSHERKMLKKESLYNNLFDSWVPTMMGSDLVDEGDDQEWLFGKKGEERQAQRSKVSEPESKSSFDHLQRCSSAVMQPRAQFLPDADIYALPFTVPF